jgi:hypothetical protein
MLRTVAAGLILVLGIVAFASAAAAKIRCDGRYQIMRGGDEIATPFCEDQFLAEVAQRAYGVSTSARAVRASIHEKERVCWVVGHDARVDDICLEFLREGRDHVLK